MWHAGRSHGRMTLKCGPSHGVMPLPCDRRLRLLQCITFGSDGGNTLKRPLQKLAGKWRSGLTTAAFCHRVTPFWRIAYPLVLLRARRLCKREGFEPAEAFRLGLFQPRSRRHRHGEVRQPQAIDEGPGVAEPGCLGAPAPEQRLVLPLLHGGRGRRSPGCTPSSTRNCPAGPTRDISCEPAATGWRSSTTTCPRSSSVKPAEGAYGQGFDLFRRSDKGYVNAAGKHMETGDLYDLLVPHATAGYVIQERLHNHPELIRLGDTETLQTVRIITLVDNDGQVHILHAHLKIIEGDEVIDTLLRGLTGNIEAPVELRHGTLRAANSDPGDRGCRDDHTGSPEDKDRVRRPAAALLGRGVSPRTADGGQVHPHPDDRLGCRIDAGWSRHRRGQCLVGPSQPARRHGRDPQSIERTLPAEDSAIRARC